MKINKSNHVVCIAKIVVKQDSLDEVLKIFSELKKSSPIESGCLRYELHQDQDNPLIFTFIDRFENMKAFEYHCEQEYTIKYFDNILPILTESIEITIHNEIEL